MRSQTALLRLLSSHGSDAGAVATYRRIRAACGAAAANVDVDAHAFEVTLVVLNARRQAQP